MKKVILLIAGVLFSANVFAVDCPEVIEHDSNVSIHQLKLETGNCTVTLSDTTFTTKKPFKKVYPSRSMIWNSEGRLTSFIDSGKSTGARAYYILPVSSNLKTDGEMKQGASYQVKASEQVWSMNKASAQLSLPPTCKGNVLPAAMNNRGGLDITSCKNKLVIDAGWKVGSSPDLEREGQSTIHDPQGASCAVDNKDIYKYQPGEEPSPKFVTSQDWFDFLKDQPTCQNLNIDFLKDTSRPTGQISHRPSSGAR